MSGACSLLYVRRPAVTAVRVVAGRRAVPDRVGRALASGRSAAIVVGGRRGVTLFTPPRPVQGAGVAGGPPRAGPSPPPCAGGFYLFPLLPPTGGGGGWR